MIKSEEIDDPNLNKAQLFNLEITPENNEQLKNFELAPFDLVSIRKMPVYEKPEMVTVSGAVNYAGNYVLANKKERIYDIVKRAGGLNSLADINGIKIKRPILGKQIEIVESVDLNLGKKLKDYATIPIDWKSIVKNPKNNSNILLFPGDEIEVAFFNDGVKVSGNVLLTSEIPYDKGKGFGHYINAVGGVNNKAYKKKAYIIYPNGKAAVTTSFLFIRSYPKVRLWFLKNQKLKK
jgi:protein involved in polysaccharide export with SLBB domain